MSPESKVKGPSCLMMPHTHIQKWTCAKMYVHSYSETDGLSMPGNYTQKDTEGLYSITPADK